MKVQLFAASMLVVSLANATTPIDGWYSTVFGGYAYLPNNVSTTINALTFTNARYHSGYDAGGSLGFKSNPLRYEGELSYINATADKFNLNNVLQTEVGGYSNAIIGMANIYYDFRGLLCCIQPYLGGGIGYGWVHAKLHNLVTDNRLDTTDGVFAYQAMTGLTYHYTENFSFALGYRYLATERPEKLGKVFQANLGNLIVTYRFDENNYK